MFDRKNISKSVTFDDGDLKVLENTIYKLVLKSGISYSVYDWGIVITLVIDYLILYMTHLQIYEISFCSY